jgi:hypothetical protein
MLLKDELQLHPPPTITLFSDVLLFNCPRPYNYLLTGVLLFNCPRPYNNVFF